MLVASKSDWVFSVMGVRLDAGGRCGKLIDILAARAVLNGNSLYVKPGDKPL